MRVRRAGVRARPRLSVGGAAERGRSPGEDASCEAEGGRSVTRSAVLVLGPGARREPFWGVAEEAWDGRDRLQQADPGRGGSDILPPPDARPPPGGRRSRLSCRARRQVGREPARTPPAATSSWIRSPPPRRDRKECGAGSFPVENFSSEARK
jgi:hypothetical protein